MTALSDLHASLDTAKLGSDLQAPTTGDGSHDGNAQLLTAPEELEWMEEDPQGPGHHISAVQNETVPISRKLANALAAFVTEYEKESDAKQLPQARARVDTNPTDPQISAGNYRKGHLSLHGLPITLENPKGSTRSGTDRNGKSWSIKMKNDYGYIKGTVGKDGDQVDVFIGPDPDTETVFVVNQVLGGKFDEHKCCLGFKSRSEARRGYLANYQKGWHGLGSIYPLTIPQFKWWLSNGSQGKQVTDGTFAKKAAARCPGCNKPFKKDEPYPDVKMCEVCERYGTKRADEDRKPSVAVDLDGTLAKELEEFDPKVIGPPRPGAKKWMQEFRDAGASIIVHTCRGDDKVTAAWLDEHDIEYDHINENPNQPPDTSDKLYADVYYDNRAIDASGALASSAPEVIERLSEAKTACDLDSLHGFIAGNKSATTQPIYQQALLGQIARPSWDPQGNWLTNTLSNLRQARARGQRIVRDKDEVQNIRSALEPGFALRRFQNFARHGDFVKDPIDQALFRGNF